jgi:hypothetical protein
MRKTKRQLGHAELTTIEKEYAVAMVNGMLTTKHRLILRPPPGAAEGSNGLNNRRSNTKWVLKPRRIRGRQRTSR